MTMLELLEESPIIAAVKRKMIMVVENGRSQAVLQIAGAWIAERLSMISISRFTIKQAVRSTRISVIMPDCQV